MKSISLPFECLEIIMHLNIYSNKTWNIKKLYGLFLQRKGVKKLESYTCIYDTICKVSMLAHFITGISYFLKHTIMTGNMKTIWMDMLIPSSTASLVVLYYF